MNLLIVGDGRMGTLVKALAPEYGFNVVGMLGETDNAGGAALTSARCQGVDVAIEFSTPASALDNIRALAACGVDSVIGTTGWRVHESSVRQMVAHAGVGVVVAANFSLGANILELVSAHMASLLRGRPEYGAFLHEQHHAAKKDAPSGTALSIVDALKAADPQRDVDVSSSRAGYQPGTHTVGFDGPAEHLAITHLVRDRAAFAHGALVAARWVIGRTGWFTMRDVLGIGPDTERR